MSVENLLIANPYNDNHMKLFDKFEKINHLSEKNTSYTSFMKSIRLAYSEEDYQKIQWKKNEIYQIVFSMEKNQIKDSCYIREERDRKICELYFAPLNTEKNRQILTDVSNYVLDKLGMEQVFVSISPLDSKLKSSLELKGFENIGIVNGELKFIKGKEEKLEMGRVR